MCPSLDFRCVVYVWKKMNKFVWCIFVLFFVISEEEMSQPPTYVVLQVNIIQTLWAVTTVYLPSLFCVTWLIDWIKHSFLPTWKIVHLEHNIDMQLIGGEKCSHLLHNGRISKVRYAPKTWKSYCIPSVQKNPDCFLSWSRRGRHSFSWLPGQRSGSD